MIQALCKEGTRVATPGKEPRSKSCVSDNTGFSFMFQLCSTLRTRQNVSAVASSKMHSIRMQFHAMVSFLIQKNGFQDNGNWRRCLHARYSIYIYDIYVNICKCMYIYIYVNKNMYVCMHIHI